MAMFLVIMNMGSILYFEYFIDGNYTMNAYSNIQHDESIKDTPDIYYLIFDRYPHSDILRKNYDYDNRYFDRYLEHKGFYNVKKATANYPRTELSLASSLGMTYLDFLTPIVGEKSSSMGPINKLRDGSKVAVFLKGKGYRFIHLGHLYGKLDKNSVVDVRINNYRKKNRIEGETKTTLESFGMKLFDETTLLGSVMTSMSINNKEYPSDKYHPKAVLKAQGMESTFEVLKQIPKQQDKKFVFAHFVVPHEPYVFNRDGTVVTRKQTKQRTKLAELKHQIGYTNKKIFEVVEAILAQSESDPIIIIQSDEGPYPDDVWNESTSVKKNNHTWHKADDKTLQEKLRIINFIYLPEEYENPFYATITPVNTFRVLFNVVFGSKLELLPDRNYVFHDAKHLYKFIDVTDRVAFID